MSVFVTKYCRIGVGICRDIRFPEYALILARDLNCKMLCYPSNFSQKLGKLHWDHLTRCRAFDSQAFMLTCACAENTEEPHLFKSWARSRVISPLGDMLCEDDRTDECVLLADTDISEVD